MPSGYLPPNMAPAPRTPSSSSGGSMPSWIAQLMRALHSSSIDPAIAQSALGALPGAFGAFANMFGSLQNLQGQKYTTMSNLLGNAMNAPSSDQIQKSYARLMGFGERLDAPTAQARSIAEEGLYGGGVMDKMMGQAAEAVAAQNAGQRQALFGTAGGGASGRVKAALAANQATTGKQSMGKTLTDLLAQNEQTKLAGLGQWQNLLGMSGNNMAQQIALDQINTDRPTEMWRHLLPSLVGGLTT